MTLPFDPDLLSRELTDEDAVTLAMALLEMEKEQDRARWQGLFPDEGPLRRDLYPKHMEFFAAGAKYRERLALFGNRVGKTVCAGYEVSCHLTGDYPHWWIGRRFEHPIDAWVAGDTNETTRDIIQKQLLGDTTWNGSTKSFDGVGIIPFDCHGKPKFKPNTGDLLDHIEIKHRPTGKWSRLAFKSYDQGRRAFQGTAKHLCIAEGELVQMADGTLRPIERVEPGEMVLSVDTKGRVVSRRVTARHSMGERECVRLTPKQGSPVILTPDHEVYWGYRKDSKCRADETAKVAQVRPGLIPSEVTESRGPAWLAWAALVVAEGTVSQRKVTNGDVTAMERVIALLPPEASVRRQDFKCNHVPDWFLAWPEFWDAFPAGLSHQKAVPDWIFRSSDADISLFLRWLFMGDGWANGHTIGYATTSPVLATQIVALLHRLGIRASSYLKRHNNGRWRDQYWVQITRSDEVVRFVDRVGIESKEAACEKVRAEAARRCQSKIDRAERLVQNPKARDFYHRRNEQVRVKASKVRCVEPAGIHLVYDLSVEGEHRFLVGGNLVSNCWLDEECPEDVYGECLIRTATTNGMAILTFTPLRGMTPLVRSFLAPDTGEIERA